VSRIQTMPPPAGQSFIIIPADRRDRADYAFPEYSDLVRRHLLSLGYAEASPPGNASLVVCFAYGLDDGTHMLDLRSYHPPYSHPLLGAYAYPGQILVYHGWEDGIVFQDSRLDLGIHQAVDGLSVFEGRATARSSGISAMDLVPNLIDAMFAGFPGISGESIDVELPATPRDAAAASASFLIRAG
jgi:hypothetical protein